MSISAIGLTFLSVVIFYLAKSTTDRQRRIRENDLLKQKVQIEMGSVEALADSTSVGRGQMIWKMDNGVLMGGTEGRTDSSIACY